MDVSKVKALTFDVFGTVVDWRGTIISEGKKLSEDKGFKGNWAKFADSWRAGYEPSMNRVRLGGLPWMNIDALHRIILDKLLSDCNIVGLTEAEIDYLNRVWHRLKPWLDVRAALERMRQRFVVAALSNGNMALLVNMAKYADIRWDCILSSELARPYKPDPEVYQTAADLLGLRTEQIMLVAAHKHDLHGAQAVGMKTAFVLRPMEFGSKQKSDTTQDTSFDMFAIDFEDLANKLTVAR